MLRKVFILILSISLFVSCKNETKTEEVNLEENRAKSYDQNDGYTTMRGEFVYDSEKKAAVFQTQSEIYGVVIDDNMLLLDKEVKPYKKEITDMVPVTVRVRTFEKDSLEEGWQYRVEIKEILKVETPDHNKEDVIKLAN